MAHTRFGIYAQFEQDGHTEIGVLFPGKSFINSSLLLGDSVKTDQVGKCFSSLDPKVSSFNKFWFSRSCVCSSPLACPFAWTLSVRLYTVTILAIFILIIIFIIIMLIQVSRLVPESGGSLGLGAKAEPGDKKVKKAISINYHIHDFKHMILI